MTKSNVSNFILWSLSFVMFLIFFSIELRYTCPVIDQRFGIATSTTGPSFLRKFAYNTVFVLWHCFAVTWRFAFLVFEFFLV